MSTHRVYLIGIGPGAGTELLTVRALAALDGASRVFYPGERLDTALRARLGDKLVTAKSTDATALFEEVLAHWRSGHTPAVLFSGDGAFYSGEPGVCLAESQWAARLERAGVPFEQCSGLSAVQLALRAAGLSLPTERGFGMIVAAPFQEGCDSG